MRRRLVSNDARKHSGFREEEPNFSRHWLIALANRITQEALDTNRSNLQVSNTLELYWTVAIAWLTGLGARSSDDRPVPQDLKEELGLQVKVGGQEARVLYAGPSGCCAGVDQVAFEIPAGPEGCFVPVVMLIGESVGNFVSLAVSSSGRDAPAADRPHGRPIALQLDDIGGGSLLRRIVEQDFTAADLRHLG